ncbi:AAA family ATPase [Luteolibacter sp. AS25]|uniref:AAA family ATPase n=1 Tax=Luteolibacter sp. AS25 TaxID=3135776 RepID=UPI00398A9B9E
MNKVILSPGQANVIEKLCPLVHLATSGVVSKLPVRPRTSTLLLGRSGTGKSHVARELAKQCNLPIWEANVANWIVLGARGERHTMIDLVNWVQRHKSGIIFLDELDKLNSDGDWVNNIRLEIHDLIDSRIPNGAFETEYKDKYDDHSTSLNTSNIKTSSVQEKLRTSFFILGAGTCMGAWTSNKGGIGFGAMAVDNTQISRKQVLDYMSPEILQRFRADICFLEPLARNDYLTVAASIMKRLPGRLVTPFGQALADSLPSALEHGLGMRIFEEILADIWAVEFAQHRENPNVWVYLAKPEKRTGIATINVPNYRSE